MEHGAQVTSYVWSADRPECVRAAEHESKSSVPAFGSRHELRAFRSCAWCCCQRGVKAKTNPYGVDNTPKLLPLLLLYYNYSRLSSH